MKDLSPRQERAFKLREVEGLKLREVGEKLGREGGLGAITASRARALKEKGRRTLDNPCNITHPLWLRVNEIREKAGL